MIVAVLAAVAAVLAVAGAGPSLARRLPPRWAVWLVGPAIVGAAGSGVFVLAVVTFLWVAQLSEVAEHGSWSGPALQALDPISAPVSMAAGLLLMPASAWAAWTVWARLREIRTWSRIERQLPVDEGAVRVLDTTDIDAFTLPSGTVLVTTGLLDALTPAERRIVVAHERSHRRHRHVWWRLAVDLAAALNPLLRRAANAVGDMTERWADEDAARVAGRREVATAIGRVALLRSARSRPSVAGATGGSVPDRVRALLAPPPRVRAGHLAAALALVMAVAVTVLAVQQSGESLFESATRPASVTAPH